MRIRGPSRFWLERAGRAAPAHLREAVRGDLVEEWAAKAAVQGEAAASRWLRSQVVRSVLPLVLARRGAVRGEAMEPRERRMGTLWQDVWHTGRLLRRAPGFTAMIVLTLGLGIAACTVVLSVVDGAVLNPFPYPEPGRLVGVGTAYPRLNEELGFWENLSPAEYLDIRDQARTLERVVAWDMGHRAISVDGAAENLFSAFWWGDAFPTLGVRPAYGRGFTAEEVANGEAVAILSWRVFQNRFGGDPSLVGGTVRVNDEPYVLVGVMPPGTSIYGTDLWLPMPIEPETFPRDRRQFQVLGRIAPGQTLETVNAELATLAQRVMAVHGQAFPEYAGWRMQALTWDDINVRTLKLAAFVLLGAVGFVLLLVCTNVASLLLGRAAGRSRELAVRSALGAGRGRLVRQLLTESVALAMAGGVVGVGLGWLGVGALVDTLSALAMPIPGEIALNGRVLLVAALVSVAAGILFGLVPALHAGRADLRGVLQAGGNSITLTRGRLRVQRALVALEVALSLILLTGGGLLIHSFLRLNAVDPGFRAENVLTMRLTLARERYPSDRIEPFFRELTERVMGLPGVQSAAVTSQFPPVAFSRQSFEIEGVPPADEDNLPTAFTTVASPGYFETLGVLLLRGRVFQPSDGPETPRMAVINRTAAERWFPAGEVVGRRIRVGDGPWFEVAGVVADTRNVGLDAPAQPEILASTQQLSGSWNQLFLLVRTEGDPYGVLPAVRAEVAAMDPEQPIYGIRTIAETFAEAQSQRRIATTMLTLFGAFALLLAALGIYAVASYAVAQRTREIGVRIALGASRGNVLSLVVKQSLLPVALGGVAGIAGALLVGSFLRGLLFEVGTVDVPTMLAVLAIFSVIATLASWLPARRGTRLDPVAALRAKE